MIRTIEFAVANIRLHSFDCGTSDGDWLDFELVNSVWPKISDRARGEFNRLCCGLITGDFDRFNQFKRSGKTGHLAVLST